MKIKANLISGRTAKQGANLEAKTYKSYFEACSYCELNSVDLDKLGAYEGNSLKVTSEFGEVVVFAKANDGNPKGLAFIPMGPWANTVLNPDTHGCGMPGLKGVPAEIEITDEKPLDMKSLMKKYLEN
ncbi:molybdopterin dinucleotide binding domain-containing protein [Methanosarcina barkeri]|uniref:Formylmethanofuran dehydrogenase (Tungsten) subunit D n=1 Tax=Methanosarcina barkeri 227 TaxID=1434106 RepID=A0A0E3R1Z8_METBA|nr:molybdopterin dinucleotide binding domain-containing protein [Methanosarcina barkeri]AKB58245.1 Formylmethanofuran dehydrogenase (tungsten) subunit D [Methanosarcina barkeri 227]